MKQWKKSGILIALMALGLVAALALVWQRHQVEVQSNVVELVADYEDLTQLARREGIPVEDVLQQFRQAGLTSLAIYETTLEKLHNSGKVTVLPGSQILHSYYGGGITDPYFRSLVEKGQVEVNSLYVIGKDSAVFAEVMHDLVTRFGSARVQQLTDGSRPILLVKGDYEKTLKDHLGLPSDEMKQAEKFGYFIVARPTNYEKVTSSQVEDLFNRLAPFQNVSGLMFSGDETTGFPSEVNLTGSIMKERGYTLHMIEHPLQLQFFKQEGLLDLARLNDYHSARVYAIPKDEQPKLKVDEAIHRWVVTDEERNIRVDLMRFFEKPEPGQTLFETNLRYVRESAKGLESHGFALGRAGTFNHYFPQPWLLVVTALGAAAALCLYLSLVTPIRQSWLWLLYLLLVVPTAVLILSGKGTLARQILAMISAIVVPVLAMAYQIDLWRSQGESRGSLGTILGHGLIGVTRAVALAMVGGMYVAALLGDVRFFLEMEIYRGVKATFVMPLLLVILFYLTRYQVFGTVSSSIPKLGPQIRRLLETPIYVKTLLAFAFLAVVAWVFVGRSGHTAGVPVPGIELQVRDFLEKVMYARPREKEFMIGHPAFFLSVLAFYRQWPKWAHFALVLTATIALGSLVETFAHLRTPVFMSFVRGWDGWLIGSVFGILSVVMVHLLQYLSLFIKRKGD